MASSRDEFVKELFDNIDKLDKQLPRAVECLHWMVDKLISKGHDYAGVEDPLSNLRGSEELEIPPHRGVLVRMRDKWQRIINFNRIGRLEVKDESISQTVLDLANYCILLHIIWMDPGEARREAEDKLIYGVKKDDDYHYGGRFA